MWFIMLTLFIQNDRWQWFLSHIQTSASPFSECVCFLLNQVVQVDRPQKCNNGRSPQNVFHFLVQRLFDEHLKLFPSKKLHIGHNGKTKLKMDLSLHFDLGKMMKTLCHFCLLSFKYWRSMWKKSNQRTQYDFYWRHMLAPEPARGISKPTAPGAQHHLKAFKDKLTDVSMARLGAQQQNLGLK